MQQEKKDTETIKTDLLKDWMKEDPSNDPDFFGASIEDVQKVVHGEKNLEWFRLIEDYPVQEGKLYLFYPSSPNPDWGRGVEAAPSYRNLYQALDRHAVNRSIQLCTVSVPLGVIPQEYYPIRPNTHCPGIQRWFVEKHGMEWEWRMYRDVINTVARQVAKFMHDQKVKRRHVVIVRKNSMEHDIWRTVVTLLTGQLDIRPCPYPLWSEEAVDFIDDVVREMADDIEHLDL